MTPATYTWSGGAESMLRFGPNTGPIVIVAQPLFEEANRTRALIVTICRALAERGIASVLPDLPGTGESLVETQDAALSDWRSAFSAAVDAIGSGRTVHGVAIRGGALLDTQAGLASRYHVAPATGAAVVREMIRTRLAAAKESGERFDPAAISPPGLPIELAGNRIDRQLLADLAIAVPTTTGSLRTMRLLTDAAPADHKIDAPPLWRRAEPDNDVALAHLLAQDITAWIAACDT